MIGYHPAIGQINAFLELDRDHLWIDLNNNPLKPISDTLITFIVVTKDLYTVPHVILLLQVRSMCEM